MILSSGAPGELALVAGAGRAEAYTREWAEVVEGFGRTRPSGRNGDLYVVIV